MPVFFLFRVTFQFKTNAAIRREITFVNLYVIYNNFNKASIVNYFVPKFEYENININKVLATECK